MKALSRTQQLKNRRGLHESPAAGIVETANKFDAELRVCRDGNRTCARSIFEILRLGCKHGDSLELLAVEHDADTALSELHFCMHIATSGIHAIHRPMERLSPLLRNGCAVVHSSAGSSIRVT